MRRVLQVGRYGDFEARVPAGWRIGLGPDALEDVDPELLPVMGAGPGNVRDSGILVFRHDGASLTEAEDFWRRGSIGRTSARLAPATGAISARCSSRGRASIQAPGRPGTSSWPKRPFRRVLGRVL